MEDTASREFGNFLQSNDSLDLDFVGSCLTWCNNRSGGARVWEIIDKFFLLLLGFNCTLSIWCGILPELLLIIARSFFPLMLQSFAILHSGLKNFGSLILDHGRLLWRFGGCPSGLMLLIGFLAS